MSRREPPISAGDATETFPTDYQISMRMRQTYDVTGDRWFWFAAEALARPAHAPTAGVEKS